MSRLDPVVLMLRDRTRAAIAAKSEDALPVFEALLAAMLAALAAPTQAAAERPRTLATKGELMVLLSIRSPRTIEKMVKTGEIPGDAVVRVGRMVRFDLERVIAALRGVRPDVILPRFGGQSDYAAIMDIFIFNSNSIGLT
jgi:hypothetical protein